VDPLAAIYAAACARDPSYGALFHELGPSREREALLWFFTRRLRIILAQLSRVAGGALLVAEDGGGAVIGGVGLLPPAAAHPSLWAAASWAAAWLCAFGLRSLLRLLSLDAQYSAGLAPQPGECEVVMLAVAASARRGGVGSALLRAALHLAPPRARLLLGTNTAANARWYAARGWSLASTRAIVVDGSPPYTQHVFRAQREAALTGAADSARG
jgi:ribosomal protein S18 acetylase RimI-like enzyme